jgi:LysR family glycine cleavage system transcriptional activator
MPVRPPSLRSIAAFEAAARHASFTRAADELNLTPGAISHAIKALELRLDQQLFKREGRAVALTEAGRMLAARVRLSLGLLADAFDTSSWRARDRLVISTLSSIAERLLLPGLPGLKAAAPGMMLDLRCTTALADLDRDIDLAIRFDPGGWCGCSNAKCPPSTAIGPCGTPARPSFPSSRPLSMPSSACSLMNWPQRRIEPI